MSSMCSILVSILLFSSCTPSPSKAPYLSIQRTLLGRLGKSTKRAEKLDNKEYTIQLFNKYLEQLQAKFKPYDPIFRAFDIKEGSAGKIQILAKFTQYKFGIITRAFFIVEFDKSQKSPKAAIDQIFPHKKELCSVQIQEDGKHVSGETKCDDDFATQLFQKN